MLALLALFAGGVALLLISTQAFVKMSEELSKAAKLSPLIVGVTLVAIGTSLPELAVSTIAAIRGDSGLAMGNIVGSNITNILLILPLGILIGKLRIGTTKTQRNSLVLLAATAFFIVWAHTPIFQVYKGLVLIAISLAVIYAEYQWGVIGRHHEDFKRLRGTSVKLSLLKISSIPLLLAGISAGGIAVVLSVEKIASISGLSTTILGLSLTALATSLPELFTTILAQEEDQEKITIGNIIGSNIYNLLLIGGIVQLFGTNTTIDNTELVWLIIATAGFTGVLWSFKGAIVPKLVAGASLALLAAYLVTLGTL